MPRAEAFSRRYREIPRLPGALLRPPLFIAVRKDDNNLHVFTMGRELFKERNIASRTDWSKFALYLEKCVIFHRTLYYCSTLATVLLSLEFVIMR